MEITNIQRIWITEASQVGEARRTSKRLALAQGFGEVDGEKVSIVTTELAGNLNKHAKDGEIQIRTLVKDGVGGLEILALDRGPGITNVAACLRDGYSTSTNHSQGTGLGAVNRMAALLKVHSLPGVGTALLARLWAKPLPAVSQPDPLEVSGVCLPIAGEKACGDAWAVHQSRDRGLLLVADGLGHGPGAAAASAAAVQAFQQHHRSSPLDVVKAIHAALSQTRGAAVAVAEVDTTRQKIRYAGLGNIAGVIVSPTGRCHMVSHTGTAGREAGRIQEFDYPWPPEALLVMHSDGLTSSWKLDSYPGLTMMPPSLIAGVLYRDFNRRRDDVTVVVAGQSVASDHRA